MPTEYQVIWEIDLAADSPVEAAREALRIQRDPASLATVFDVIDPDGRRVRIDLETGDSETNGPEESGAHP